MSVLDVDQARDEVPYAVKLSPLYQKLLEDFHAGCRSPQRDLDNSSKIMEDTSKSTGVSAARKKSREHAASPECLKVLSAFGTKVAASPYHSSDHASVYLLPLACIPAKPVLL